MGYLQNFGSLKRKIKEFGPDIIHAHYGLCGVLANLQRRVPVVTTFHGSDINLPTVLKWSKIAMALSAHSIFVSKRNIAIAGPKKNFSLIPCGINLSDYPEMSKEEARKALGWPLEAKKVLFAGAFDNKVKNAPLAKDAVALLPGVDLVELKGFSRSEVSVLMNAADALLMTSLTEGSPQVVKEALACNCPVVSVDVGDVGEVVVNVEECAIVPRSPEKIAGALKLVLERGVRIRGRERIVDNGMTNDIAVEKLMSVYRSVV
jgi:Glycosyltransferase